MISSRRMPFANGTSDRATAASTSTRTAGLSRSRADETRDGLGGIAMAVDPQRRREMADAHQARNMK